jgi:hypothetical protein
MNRPNVTRVFLVFLSFITAAAIFGCSKQTTGPAGATAL